MADLWTAVGVVASVVSAGTTVFAVAFARGQIIAAAALSQAQFVDSLEREFAALAAIQLRVRLGGRWAESPGPETEVEIAELQTLLSFFEKLHFIEAAGVLRLDDLDALFGTRFFETWSNVNVQRILDETGGPVAWAALYALHARWADITTRQMDGSVARPPRRLPTRR